MQVPSHLQWWSNLCTQFPQKWQWNARSGRIILHVWQNFILDRCVELADTMRAEPELEFFPLVSSMFSYVRILSSSRGMIPGLDITVERNPKLVRTWHTIKETERIFVLSSIRPKY